ncbi:hypothetical protein Poly24_47990 [Rosistilla carotiformis]|uniref:Uncharacterized protein n=1 Tax=Rosistilla carotiformis TaxID=2528017 RepID=A0A518JZU1_9BACT|nr:hypothetical protein [Rosistilla carotiformis]QDV71066.1 hypothetical protein Poly24_47990 [Rosistilla carotiformis]
MSIQLIAANVTSLSPTLIRPAGNEVADVRQRVLRYLHDAGLASDVAAQKANQIVTNVYEQDANADHITLRRSAMMLAIAAVQIQPEQLPLRSVPTECWRGMVKADGTRHKRRLPRSWSFGSIGHALQRQNTPNSAARTY